VSFLNIAFMTNIFESAHLDAKITRLFQLSAYSPKISLNFIFKICDEIWIFMFTDWATHYIKFGCKCEFGIYCDMKVETRNSLTIMDGNC
jgi:hypothetical protein